MQFVSILDTTICDNNLGNAIIMESVDSFVEDAFSHDFLVRIPYLDTLGKKALQYLGKSDYSLLGGTNALSADMARYSQLGITQENCSKLGNGITLIGVGWWQYQSEISPETANILQNALASTGAHSVRDEYTKKKLASIGILNVVNTGCPSLWNLHEKHCQSIPENKAKSVLATLTNYNQTPEQDQDLLRLLAKCYETVYFWVQGPEDHEYVNSLDAEVEILPPRLESLDALLQSSIDLDYVGTRLHAGIRALQHKRRSMILGIDNRALEMGRDFHLPVLPRDSLDELEEKIHTPSPCSIRIPHESIEKWKSQFFQNERKTSSQKAESHCQQRLRKVNLAELIRTTPISRKFGVDLGTPIDRYYIESFIGENQAMIRGEILEIEDDHYSQKYGVDVVSIDVLNVVNTPKCTIVGDLASGEGIPTDQYDCIICTQTIQVIFDLNNTLLHLMNALIPGGKLLVSASGISQISRFDYDRWGEYWRFTELSLEKISMQCSLCSKVQVKSYGNVASAKAFLDGVPLELMNEKVLNFHDNDYQLSVCAVLTRKAD